MTYNILYSGWRNVLLCSIVIVCSFGQGFGQYPESSPRGSAYDLTKLNVYPHSDNDAFWYQARCSIPCSGTYSPDTLHITINADRVFGPEFEAYGNFEASQLEYSNIWWIRNINWLSANNGRCQFDFQFVYTTRYPEPTGTCQIGWNMSTECLVPDNTPSCTDVGSNPGLCYDQAIYSQCCYTCTSRDDSSPDDDIYCPYGDRDQTMCDGIDQAACYTVNYTCCGTCETYEEDIEGCRYGNRDPNVCDFIVHADCYNTTLERDCCYECNALADRNYPDCVYGDKSTRCNSISRSDCYQEDTERTCCETCAGYSSDIVPNCEYGDIEYCFDVQRNQCQNNKTIRENCCETCNYLIENDCNNDQNSCPFDIPPSECYDGDTRRKCCRTCLSYYDVSQGANCLYGDRRPNLCYNITGTMCYNSDVALDCCLQCSYFALDHLPQTCLYGNKDPCSNLNVSSCYQPTVEDRCCETCHSYNRTDIGFDCRYGDKIDSCYSRPLYTCYDDTSRDTCCQYCSVHENMEDPDCRYGDKLALCTVTLTPVMCYSYDTECCVSCNYMVKGHLDQDTCRYGDRRNCSGTTASQCYNTNVEYDCCETCYYLRNPTNNGCEFGDSANCSNISPWQCYDRDEECCATCENYIKPELVAEDCMYGNRAINCPTINSYQCYDPDTAYKCCETCIDYRRDDLPDSCAYGDTSSLCASGDAHASFCYNATIRDQCCAACQLIQTGDPACLYGDKATYCDDIEARNCYQGNTESTCCQTCPEFYRPNYPQGCEYGDSNNNCQESSCPRYSSQKLEDCCYTCRAYLTTTPPTTTVATPTGTEESTGGVDTNSTMPSTTRVSMTTSQPDTPLYETTPSTTWRPGRNSTTTTNDESSTTTTSSLTTKITTNEIDETTQSSEVMGPTEAIFDNTGAIIGGIIGAIIVIIVIVAVAFYCIRVRKRTPKPDYDKPSFDAIDAHRQNQFTSLPVSSVHYNPNGQTSFNPAAPGYSRTPGTSSLNIQQQQKAPPRRQESEEVYDYINPDDVKSEVSMPITRRPTLPDRKEENPYEPYLEPANNEKAEYNSLGQPSTNDHQYYVLEKEPEQRL